MTMRWGWIVLGAAAILAGCAKSEITPVEGVVLFDGKPLASADLIFQRDPGGRPVSAAKTDAEGKFKLVTEQAEMGALIGTHKVAVRKLKLEGVTEEEGGLSGLSYPGQVREIWEIPEKYGMLETSGLIVEVKPGEPVKIELKSEPPAE